MAEHGAAVFAAGVYRAVVDPELQADGLLQHPRQPQVHVHIAYSSHMFTKET